MINVLIASSAAIARSYAIIDWGWTLEKLHPLTFKNLKQEQVEYKPITSVYSLRAISDKGKLYYVMDGLERFPNDLDELRFHINNGWTLIRRPANEEKL